MRIKWGQMKKEPTMFDLPDDAVLYAALNARDPAYEGRAYVGVTSTGIFCRLTCPARKPRPENCRWFSTAREAEAAGFRPCKRCHPVGATAEGDASVSALRRAMEADPGRRWTEADVEEMRYGDRDYRGCRSTQYSRQEARYRHADAMLKARKSKP